MRRSFPLALKQCRQTRRRSKTLAGQGGEQHVKVVRPKYGAGDSSCARGTRGRAAVLLEVAPQGAVCSTKIVHQPDVRSRPCQQGKDWQHCATVSDGARLRCRSKRVEVRRCRVRVHQATEQSLTRPLSGPDKVQRNTGKSCEHKPRRKRDVSTNYGATIQRPVGHRLGGRQRSDAFDVAIRLQGSAKARHLESQKWVRRVLNCGAGASVRQDRGHRDSKRVSESPADCTSADGRRRVLATTGDAWHRWSCASAEQH